MLRTVSSLLLVSSVAAFALTGVATAQEKPTFKVGYVVYVGFMPLAWMKQSGSMEAWSDKYGVNVELVQINDYIGGINQFIAGDLDAVAVAGMDALTMPAASGVDTSIFLIADYSNGNDMLLSRSATSVADLKGQDVYLLQYSVSHYLLSRALDKAGINAPGVVQMTNISDTEIAAAYMTQPDMLHVATWNPMASELVSAVDGTNVLFDSSEIPGEIMDSFIARTDTLATNPEFGKAFAGAWYEAMATMTANDAQTAEMVGVMASAMGTDVTGLKAQLDATYFFTEPATALEFMLADSTAEIWDLVRTFSFDNGLFGQGATGVDDIGIAVNAGTTLGDPENVMLRIDPSFVAAAQAGEL